MINTLVNKLTTNEEYESYCNGEVCDTDYLCDSCYWMMKEVGNEANLALTLEIKVNKNREIIITAENKSRMIKWQYKVPQKGSAETAQDIKKELDLLVNGSLAIDKLNEIIFNKQQSSGTEVFIRFKFGLGAYSEIGREWNYNRLVVRLNRNAVKTLAEMYKTNTIVDCIESKLGNEWDTTIGKFIKGFNRFMLSERLDAKLETTSVVTELLRESITEKDIIDLITSKKKEGLGECYLVSYYDIIEELGNYLVKVECNIDMAEKEITTNLISDIYDIDEDDVIRATSGGLLVRKIKERESKIGTKLTQMIK